ncbi:MAG: FmdB family zinc ribbon protein [Chloroflexota bacterium]
MPVYEYECSACKTRFERSQRFSDPPVTECPECGAAVRRVLFPAGIVFKGSGWYITDSRKPAPSEASTASSESSSSGDGKKADGKKADSASEKKSDTATSAKSAAGSAPSAPAAKAD